MIPVIPEKELISQMFLVQYSSLKLLWQTLVQSSLEKWASTEQFYFS